MGQVLQFHQQFAEDVMRYLFGGSLSQMEELCQCLDLWDKKQKRQLNSLKNLQKPDRKIQLSAQKNDKRYNLIDFQKQQIGKERLRWLLKVIYSSHAALVAIFASIWPMMYCLASMTLSGYCLQKLCDVSDSKALKSSSTSKNNIKITIFAGLLSPVKYMTELPQYCQDGILTLQLVLVTIQVIEFVLKGATLDLIKRVKTITEPIFEEHSVLEIAVQELLNALGGRPQKESGKGEAFALIQMSQESSESLIVPIQIRALNEKFDELLKDPANQMQSSAQQLVEDRTEVELKLSKLSCKLDAVYKDTMGEQSSQEINIDKKNAMVSFQKQLESLQEFIKSKGSSEGSCWKAEFSTNIFNYQKKRSKLNLKITQLGKPNFFLLRIVSVKKPKKNDLDMQPAHNISSSLGLGMPDLKEITPYTYKNGSFKTEIDDSHESMIQKPIGSSLIVNVTQKDTQSQKPVKLDKIKFSAEVENGGENTEGRSIYAAAETQRTVVRAKNCENNYHILESNKEQENEQAMVPLVRSSDSQKADKKEIGSSGHVINQPIVNSDQLRPQQIIIQSQVASRAAQFANVTQSSFSSPIMITPNKISIIQTTKQNNFFPSPSFKNSQSLSNDYKNQQNFVFQVIHDLRHPLQAQRGIIRDTLDAIKKKRSQIYPYFDQDNKFKVRHSIRAKLHLLDRFLLQENLPEEIIRTDGVNNHSEMSHQSIIQSDLSIMRRNSYESSRNTNKFFLQRKNKTQKISQNIPHFKSSNDSQESQGKLIKPIVSEIRFVSSYQGQESGQQPKVRQDSKRKFKDKQFNQNKQYIEDQPDKNSINSPKSINQDNENEYQQVQSNNIDQNIIYVDQVREIDDEAEAEELVSDSVSASETSEKHDQEICLVNQSYKFKELKSKAQDFKRRFDGQTLTQFCQDQFISVDRKDPVSKNRRRLHSVSIERLFASQTIKSKTQFQSKNLTEQKKKVQLQFIKNKQDQAADFRSRHTHQNPRNRSISANVIKKVNQRESSNLQVKPFLGNQNMSNLELIELLKYMVVERRRLIKISENIFKFQSNFERQFEEIESQSQMTMILMNDLMDFAQLKNGSFSIVNEYFDLSDVIQKTFSMNIKQAQSKQIDLVGPVFIDPEDQIFFKLVFGDSRRYLQVLVNFVNNAIKFTKPGGSVSILLEICDLQHISRSSNSMRSKNHMIEEEKNEERSLSSIPDKEISMNSQQMAQPDCMSVKKHSSLHLVSNHQEDEILSNLVTVNVKFRLIVRDTGVGISEYNIQKLFSSFGKITEAQNQNYGVGLGLKISRDLIQAFGGKVKIKSVENKGTDFIISLKTQCKVKLDEYSKALKKKASLSSSRDQNRDKQSNQAKFKKCELFVEEVQEPNDMQSPNSLSSIKIIDSSGGSFSKSIKGLVQNSSTEKPNESPSRAKLSILDRRCLVANDSDFLLMQFEPILKKQFDHVVKVIDGQAAIDAVLAQKVNYFSMIVLDIGMPNKGGVEACQEIMKYFKDWDIDQSNVDIHNHPLLPMNKQSINYGSAQKKQFTESSMKENIKTLNQIRRKKMKTVNLNYYPKIYAVTSHTDEVLINQYKKAGFSDVYQDLNHMTLALMLQSSNLVIRHVLPSSSQEESVNELMDKSGQQTPQKDNY